MDGRNVKVFEKNPNVSVAFIGETKIPENYTKDELDELSEDEFLDKFITFPQYWKVLYFGGHTMDNKEIKKAKRINYTIFFVLIIIISIPITMLTLHKYRSKFTTEKWIQNPRKRSKLVDNLLSRYDLIGMSKEEIISLLGEDSGQEAYFKEENNFVYYLGDERGLISIDSEWLIIEFSDGVVNKVEITTD